MARIARGTRMVCYAVMFLHLNEAVKARIMTALSTDLPVLSMLLPNHCERVTYTFGSKKLNFLSHALLANMLRECRYEISGLFMDYMCLFGDDRMLFREVQHGVFMCRYSLDGVPMRYRGGLNANNEFHGFGKMETYCGKGVDGSPQWQKTYVGELQYGKPHGAGVSHGLISPCTLEIARRLFVDAKTLVIDCSWFEGVCHGSGSCVFPIECDGLVSRGRVGVTIHLGRLVDVRVYWTDVKRTGLFLHCSNGAAGGTKEEQQARKKICREATEYSAGAYEYTRRILASHVIECGMSCWL